MSVENIIALIAALGVGGVLGVILNSYFEQRKQTTEHDLKIFNESDAMLSEQNLFDIAISHLLTRRSINRDDIDLLTRSIRFHGEIGNQYLDKRLVRHSQKMFDQLNQLVSFISHNFFMIRDQNNNMDRYFLRPEWNINRAEPSSEEIEKCNQYANELQELTEKTLNQYSKYRIAIKQILKI